MSIDIKISQSVPSEGKELGRTEGLPVAPDDKLSSLFRKAMEEKPEHHDLESGGTKKDKWEPLKESMSEGSQHVASAMGNMTSPLDSLFSGRMEQTAAPAAPEPALDTQELEKLVDRILVSSPEKGGHEVRLSLGSHNNLQGTEIVLQRSVDGSLSVSVNCSDPSSFQTLVAAQTSLKAELERMEKAEVRVEVSHQTDREDNDANRRSRGYMAEDVNQF